MQPYKYSNQKGTENACWKSLLKRGIFFIEGFFKKKKKKKSHHSFPTESFGGEKAGWLARLSAKSSWLQFFTQLHRWQCGPWVFSPLAWAELLHLPASEGGQGHTASPNPKTSSCALVLFTASFAFMSLMLCDDNWHLCRFFFFFFEQILFYNSYLT